MLAIDDRIADILERYDRRQRALATGTSAQRRNPKTYEGALPGAVSSRTAPVLIWPDQRHLLPRRCATPHCGGRSGAYQHQLPTDLDRTGVTTCLLCTRAVAKWRLLAPRPPLTDDDLRPVRGRPVWCVDCAKARARTDERRCLPCHEARERGEKTRRRDPDSLAAQKMRASRARKQGAVS